MHDCFFCSVYCFHTSTMSRKILLKTSDEVDFEIDEEVALECETLKNMIEDNCIDGRIPLLNVTARTFQKVIDYCRKHVRTSTEKSENDISEFSSDKELKAWDADFVKVPQDLLFDLLMAANYLNIKGLINLTCQTIADMMRGKTPGEIRTLFHIENDYTDEEEAEVRRVNHWAFAGFS